MWRCRQVCYFRATKRGFVSLCCQTSTTASYYCELPSNPYFQSFWSPLRPCLSRWRNFQISHWSPRSRFSRCCYAILPSRSWRYTVSEIDSSIHSCQQDLCRNWTHPVTSTAGSSLRQVLVLCLKFFDGVPKFKRRSAVMSKCSTCIYQGKDDKDCSWS